VSERFREACFHYKEHFRFIFSKETKEYIIVLLMSKRESKSQIASQINGGHHHWTILTHKATFPSHMDQSLV